SGGEARRLGGWVDADSVRQSWRVADELVQQWQSAHGGRRCACGADDTLLRPVQPYSLVPGGIGMLDTGIAVRGDPAGVVRIVVPFVYRTGNALVDPLRLRLFVTGEVPDEPVADGGVDVFTGFRTAVAAGEPDNLDITACVTDLSGVRIGLFETEQCVLFTLYQQGRNVDVVGHRGRRNAV